jgi:hypothetical protein
MFIVFIFLFGYFQTSYAQQSIISISTGGNFYPGLNHKNINPLIEIKGALYSCMGDVHKNQSPQMRCLEGEEIYLDPDAASQESVALEYLKYRLRSDLEKIQIVDVQAADLSADFSFEGAFPTVRVKIVKYQYDHQNQNYIKKRLYPLGFGLTYKTEEEANDHTFGVSLFLTGGVSQDQVQINQNQQLLNQARVPLAGEVNTAVFYRFPVPKRGEIRIRFDYFLYGAIRSSRTVILTPSSSTSFVNGALGSQVIQYRIDWVGHRSRHNRRLGFYLEGQKVLKARYKVTDANGRASHAFNRDLISAPVTFGVRWGY